LLEEENFSILAHIGSFPSGQNTSLTVITLDLKFEVLNDQNERLLQLLMNQVNPFEAKLGIALIRFDVAQILNLELLCFTEKYELQFFAEYSRLLVTSRLSGLVCLYKMTCSFADSIVDVLGNVSSHGVNHVF
jgi:hypothetical protein